MIPDTGTFTAKSEKAKGRLLKIENSFKADRISVFTDSFKTENSLRDKHLIEYLNGDPKNPHSRIDITELKGQGGKAQAFLTLNGVKNPVSITYEEGSNFVDAEFEVDTTSFKLPKANYLGIGVEDKVKVTVKYYYERK